jgi:hypothetical protein
METSGELHEPAALPTGKDPPCPLDRRLREEIEERGEEAELEESIEWERRRKLDGDEENKEVKKTKLMKSNK